MQGRDGDEACHHAGGAIEIAAVRDRVEMRADNHALRIGIAAGQRHVEVGRGVALDMEAELLSNRCHRRMRTLFAGAVRIARYARFVEAVAAKLVELRCRQFTLCRNRRREIHGQTPLSREEERRGNPIQVGRHHAAHRSCVLAWRLRRGAATLPSQ